MIYREKLAQLYIRFMRAHASATQAENRARATNDKEKAQQYHANAATWRTAAGLVAEATQQADRLVQQAISENPPPDA